MRRYSQLLAIVAVVLFFSGLDLYLFMADYTAVTPRDWVTLLGVLTAPLLVYLLYHGEGFAIQLRKIVVWSIVYMAISFMWYTFAPTNAAVQELRDRLIAVLFMSLTAFVFTWRDCRRIAGVATIAVVLAMVAVNAIEMVQPDWFFMQEPTRSSGLYGNANQCGAALVIGMIIGAQLVPRRLRLSFFLLVGVGVAMTFSRSTIIGWLIATAVMLAFDSAKVQAREFVIGGVAAMVLLLFLLQGAGAVGFMDGFALDDNQADRVSFFKTLDATDGAAQERREVASKAWGMFLESPLQGNGLASTVYWSERGSTHNMFLYLMADHGIVGLFILPALLLCVVTGRPGMPQGPHWAFCAFTLWYAFFSHNVLGEAYYLLGYAFFAMGGAVGVEMTVRRPLVKVFRSIVRPRAASFPSAVGAR